MSVQTELDRIEQNVANTYAVLSALGAEMPSEQNSDNLAETAGTAKAVLYSAQTLTEAEKAQARENIGVSGGSNNNISYNDLQDRPFYAETGVVDFLPEMTVATDEEGVGVIPKKIELVVGNTYTVKWNNVEYSCVAQSFSAEGINATVVGDIGFMTSGEPVSGEPFVISCFDDASAALIGVYTLCYALDGSEYVTLSIRGESENVKKIDAKFLPQGTPYIEPFDDVILEETVLADVLVDGVVTLGGTTAYNLPIGDVVAGQIYNVILDGVCLQATASSYIYGDDAPMLCIGGNMDEATFTAGLPYSQLPFAIHIYPNWVTAQLGYTVNIRWLDGYTPEKIAITGGFKVNKLPEPLLPNFPVPLVVTFTETDAGSYEADITHLEVHCAIGMGRPVFAKAIALADVQTGEANFNFYVFCGAYNGNITFFCGKTILYNKSSEINWTSGGTITKTDFD